jgi:hypothetical protein
MNEFAVRYTTVMHAFKRFLLYVTNNEETSRHEEYFDFAFFIINSIALVFGSMYLLHIGEWEWIAFLIIEYTWAMDTMRHNR